MNFVAGEPDCNYNQIFRGIDIRIMDGNPKANGINMAGAQGTSMQDVTVWAGKGYAGIYGGDGSGGSNINVKVYGGQIGLDYSGTPLNVPTTTNFELHGQTKAAIQLTGIYDEAAAFVGGRIYPADHTVPAFFNPSPSSLYDQASFIDTIISYPSVDTNNSCAAFHTTKSLYFQGVYLENCSSLLGSQLMLKKCGNYTKEFLDVAPNAQQQQFMALNEVAIGTEMAR